MNESKIILDAIRAEREKQGINKTEFAKALGISQPAYNKIERGGTGLKIELIIKISEILKRNFFELLVKDQEENKSLISFDEMNAATFFSNLLNSQKSLHKKIDKLIGGNENES